MEEKSGVPFDKARVALARIFIGKIDESLVQDKGLRNHFPPLRMTSDTPVSRDRLPRGHQGWIDRRR